MADWYTRLKEKLLGGSSTPDPDPDPNPIPPVTGEPTKTTLYYGPSSLHSLDLYKLPELTGEHPVVIMVHGGGWTGGSKNSFSDEAKALAKLGYIAISMDYRLVPQAAYPDQIDDLRRAIDWACLRPDVDSSRIGLWGRSAGAYIAAWPSVLGQVQCFVGEWGIYNVMRSEAEVRNMLKGADARSASPIFSVGSDSAPTLLIHGIYDRRIYPSESKNLDQALHAVGVESTYKKFAGGHGPITNSGIKSDMLNHTIAFLDRHLK